TSCRRSLLRGLPRLHRLDRYGSVDASEHFADDLRALARLALALLEALRHPLVSALALHGREAFGEGRAFLERLERAPKRFFEHLGLRAEHRLRRVGVADAAAETEVFAVRDPPHDAAAIRTGERRRLSGMILGFDGASIHLRDFLFHGHLLQADA